MEVVRDDEGVPSMQVKGEARRILEKMGEPRIHLSLSHTTEHAIAYVILETV
jgi:phosphopantetheinyl transferase (holo-ACP synthase)